MDDAISNNIAEQSRANTLEASDVTGPKVRIKIVAVGPLLMSLFKRRKIY